MNRSSCLIAVSASFLSLAGFAGCGGGVEILPTVEATGSISMADADLGGLLVVFSPAVDATSGTPVNEKGRVARGAISSDGTFELFTYAEGDGAAVGSYHVTLAAPESTEPGAESEDAKKLQAVPEAYRMPTTTPLKAEVTESGPNEFSLEITHR